MIRTLLLLLAAATGSFAQIETCTIYQEIINKIVRGEDVARQTLRLVNIGETARCFALYAAGADQVNKRLFEEFVKRLEGTRTDKQSGGGVGSGGSTSTVAQGPAAKALSIATEYGALTQTIKGQVITVRGNLAGLPSALVRNNIFPYCVGDEGANAFCVGGSVLSILRRVSFGVSFDASRDGQSVTGTPVAGAAMGGAPASTAAQPVTFTGKKREISAVSGRIELLNRRDVTSQDFRRRWADEVGKKMSQAAAHLSDRAGTEFGQRVFESPVYEAWRVRSLQRVRAAGQDRDKLVAALNESLKDLVQTVGPTIPDFGDRAREALAAYNGFFLAQDELLDSLAKKSVVAFEYTDNRPAGQTPISNFRLILDVPLTAQTKFVANGAVEVYDSVPRGAATTVRRFRDAQVGMELDHGLGSPSIMGPATLSLAAYYQYQHTAALLGVDPANPIPGVSFTGLPDGANTVFTKTGNIWLVQARLSLAPKGSSVKIPIAVSYSNRTELINKPTWRAQLGVTYDFDSLFSALASR
jgi:hypothetical protein